MSALTSKIYIAIVEDDESLCRSLARLLQVSGYQPVTYLSAEAFLNDTKQPAFDCIIADIQLGGMSGIDLNRKLTATGSTTPVLFLTAQELSDELQRQLQPHCVALLRKNDPAEIVLSSIDNAIRASHTEMSAPS